MRCASSLVPLLNRRELTILGLTWTGWWLIQALAPADYAYAVAPGITLPIVVSAWLLGACRGTWLAAVALVLNATVVWLRQGSPGHTEAWMLFGQGFGSAMGLVVAWVVGRLRDLGLERDQARERERAAYSAVPDDLLRLTRDGRSSVLHRTGMHGGMPWPSGRDFTLSGIIPAELASRLEAVARAESPQASATEILDRTGATGELQRFELRAVRCGPGEALCLVRDLSSERRSEVDLQEAERAQLASRLEAEHVTQQHLVALGTIASSLSHEINNPLAFLRSNLEYLKGHLPPSPPVEPPPSGAELVEALDEAMIGADRIARLVRELKVLEPSPERERLEMVDLRAIADAAITVTRKLARDSVQVVRSYDDVPLFHSSAPALAQVAFNLLSNAIHAAAAVPGGTGSVTVRVRAVGQHAVGLEVEDSGGGIPPEVLPRIFEPFFSTRGVGEGVGLGLPTARAIVSRLGGTITVDTTPGVGTTFRVELPLASPLVTPRGGLEAVPSPAPKRLRILVVDDDANVLQAVQRLLGGHDVHLVEGGDAALSTLEAHASWDLVLCDLYMPGTDGFTVYERIRAQHPPLASRFVCMTGFAASARVRAFLTAHPGLRCLEKPFSARDIRRTVRETQAAVA